MTLDGIVPATGNQHLKWWWGWAMEHPTEPNPTGRTAAAAWSQLSHHFHFHFQLTTNDAVSKQGASITFSFGFRLALRNRRGFGPDFLPRGKTQDPQTAGVPNIDLVQSALVSFLGQMHIDIVITPLSGESCWEVGKLWPDPWRQTRDYRATDSERASGAEWPYNSMCLAQRYRLTSRFTSIFIYLVGNWIITKLCLTLS